MAFPAVVIVGAAETERLGTVPELSALELHADGCRRALADADIRHTEVDGFATPAPWPVEVAPYLGLRPRWVDGTMIGGCSYMALVRHAVAALQTGLCDVALISHGESGRSGVGTTRVVPAPTSLAGQFELPYGGARPLSTFTTPALAFLHERGMGAEDLAAVVVAQRRWCHDNPRAVRRDLLDVADVLAAPVVAHPFTRDMCCPVTDGGAALVLVRADHPAAARGGTRALHVAGAGEAVETPIASQMEQLTSFGAFRRSAADALGAAGLTVGDIDHLMIYDPFAHVPLYALEDLGFVGRGESGAFIADGETSPGGRLPMNTNGGGLSYTHTGMYGMFALQEAVRQLRGEAHRQVAGVRTSLVQGVGMSFGAAATVILTREAA